MIHFIEYEEITDNIIGERVYLLYGKYHTQYDVNIGMYKVLKIYNDPLCQFKMVKLLKDEFMAMINIINENNPNYMCLGMDPCLYMVWQSKLNSV